MIAALSPAFAETESLWLDHEGNAYLGLIGPGGVDREWARVGHVLADATEYRIDDLVGGDSGEMHDLMSQLDTLRDEWNGREDRDATRREWAATYRAQQGF